MKNRNWDKFIDMFGELRKTRSRRKILIGLGNPGEKYVTTRHNVGQWCIDRLGKRHSIEISKRSRFTIVGEGDISGHGIVLAKPRTFVNNSGQSIISLMSQYRVALEDVLIISDEMDLPVGEIRLRARGGSGGHNGIKSIIEAVGTQEFARLRIGIGRPVTSSGEVAHVLGSMTHEDEIRTEQAVDNAIDAIEMLLSEGVVAAMNRFN